MEKVVITLVKIIGSRAQAGKLDVLSVMSGLVSCKK